MNQNTLNLLAMFSTNQIQVLNEDDVTTMKNVLLCIYSGINSLAEYISAENYNPNSSKQDSNGYPQTDTYSQERVGNNFFVVSLTFKALISTSFYC